MFIPLEPASPPTSTPSAVPADEVSSAVPVAPPVESASPLPEVSPGVTSRSEAPSDAPPSAPSSSAPSPGFLASLLLKARNAIQFRKRKKLDRTVELALTKGSITNDDVQKLLRVSDATAGRYLETLVREGRLRRLGSRGGTVYEPA
jgi:hypothetical protein